MMSKIWTNGVQLSASVQNFVGKGEIARHKQFLLFLQCFQKAVLLLMHQNEYLWSKGLIGTMHLENALRLFLPEDGSYFINCNL